MQNTTTHEHPNMTATTIQQMGMMLNIDIGPAFEPEALQSRLDDIQDCANITVGAPLQRSNAIRWSGESVHRVPREDVDCGLKRKNAVRRPWTSTRNRQQLADDVAVGGASAKTVMSNRTSTPEVASSTDEPSRAKQTLPRKSRFVERLGEDDTISSAQSCKTRSTIASTLSKLKTGAKSALRHQPSYTGVAVYEGT